jgi:predicted N-acetyltransferase YhbS
VTTAVTLRPAAPAEADLLTALIRRSKAYWGYDAEFMQRAAPELALTASELRRMDALVAQDPDGAVVGVAAVDHEAVPPLLELLFVAPEAIGAGIGTTLLQAALRSAAARGLRELTIVSDPNAEPFYRAHGAIPAGDQVCGTGRSLPVLRIAVPVASD